MKDSPAQEVEPVHTDEDVAVRVDLEQVPVHGVEHQAPAGTEAPLRQWFPSLSILSLSSLSGLRGGDEWSISAPSTLIAHIELHPPRQGTSYLWRLKARCRRGKMSSSSHRYPHRG